jgi:hypothetical protein
VPDTYEQHFLEHLANEDNWKGEGGDLSGWRPGGTGVRLGGNSGEAREMTGSRATIYAAS